MSDVPEPTAAAMAIDLSEPFLSDLSESLRCRVLYAERQLAETKLTIAHQDTVHREQMEAAKAWNSQVEKQLAEAKAQRNAEMNATDKWREEAIKLQAALDRDREARLRAEEWGNEQLRAKWRAEVGAASCHYALGRSKELLEHAMVLLPNADFHHDAIGVIGMLSALLSDTNIGARLYDIIERAKKEPCNGDDGLPECKVVFGDNKGLWCLRCLLVDL